MTDSATLCRIPFRGRRPKRDIHGWLQELQSRDPSVHSELAKRQAGLRLQPAGELLNEYRDIQILTGRSIRPG